jgi:N-acylglucosamine-6-phosphate 2-epimerase
MTNVKMSLPDILEKIQGKLIVSCQAMEDEPLYGAEIMVRLARDAIQGGAAGIRANSPVDVAAIHQALPGVPLIGLYKHDLPGYEVRITPTLRHALELAEAGAGVIALDATLRPRPETDMPGLIKAVKAETGLPVLADISTLEEGLAAEAAGADLVSTTLSGYTSYSPQIEAPDLALVAALAPRLRVPLIAEGRIATPEQARQAIAVGAFSVIVGGAITRPQWITGQFVKAVEKR